MCEIKSNIEYSPENYISNKKTFIKIDAVVAEIIASKGLKDFDTHSEKLRKECTVNKQFQYSNKHF